MKIFIVFSVAFALLTTSFSSLGVALAEDGLLTEGEEVVIEKPVGDEVDPNFIPGSMSDNELVDEIVDTKELEALEDISVAFEEIPESVIYEGSDAVQAWLIENVNNQEVVDTLQSREFQSLNPNAVQTRGVVGCVSAVGAALAGAVFAPLKILKVKKALKALGGTKKFVTVAIDYYKKYRKLGYKKLIAWERAIKVASHKVSPDLQDALLGFFGITAIVSACTE